MTDRPPRKPPPAPAWLSRWTLDPPTSTARHESGAVFSLRRGHAEPLIDPATMAQLEAKHGGHNVPILLRKLAGEAAKLWAAMTDPAPPDLDNLRSEHERLKLWLATRSEKTE